VSTLTIELPDSLYSKIQELAERDGISLSQFVAIAAAEKMSALLTKEYLKSEAALGSRKDFVRALDKAPDVPPGPGDELPT
jgi:hypothetical protein